MTHNLRRRSGFTLVEMLVAAALIIFMMYIITSAFEKGLNLFSQLKIQGDLQEKLRAAETAIRLDLTAPHFGDGTALSDQRLNDQSWVPPKKGYFRIWMPGGTGIAEGVDPDGTASYSRMTSLVAPSQSAANLNTVKDLYLQFTVNLTDGHPVVRDGRGRRDQFLTVNVPTTALNAYNAPDYNATDSTLSGSYTSYWAEVTYFVKPNGKTTDGAVPLFDLYRRQVLLVEPLPSPNAVGPNSSSLPPEPAYSTSYAGISGWNSVGNGPADVTEPLRRWGMTPTLAYGQAAAANTNAPASPFPTILDQATANSPANPYADPLLGQQIGGDLLLTNVVNFEIKALWEPVVQGAANATRFVPPTISNGVIVAPGDYIAPSAINNPDYPFDQLPYGINQSVSPKFNPPGVYAPRVFDTWSANNDPAITNAQGQPVQSFGTPLAGPNVQQEYGAWNQGHFTSLTGGPTPVATQYTIPLRVRVRALQIKLRVWDQKTSQTRQMTIIQDM